MLAVGRGHVNIVRALIEMGAYLDAQTINTGETALHIACEKGEREIVQILVNEENADQVVNMVNSQGQTALQISESKIID